MDRACKSFVGLRQAEEHNGRWKVIGKFLGNLKQPEGKTLKEMQQFRLETTKYLASEGILY